MTNMTNDENTKKDQKFQSEDVNVEEPLLNENIENEEEDDEGYSYGMVGDDYVTPTVKPKSNESFVDMDGGKVLDKDDVSPFDYIKTMALQENVQVEDPRSGCRKCYGRGYIGIDLNTKAPVPCSCIFRGRTDNDRRNEELYDQKRAYGDLNRKQRRRLDKIYNKNFKRVVKKMKKNLVTSAVNTETSGSFNG